MLTKEDEKLILGFLRGEIAQRSDRGRKAQRALVRLLAFQEDLTFEIYRALTDLFDPSSQNVVIRKNWAEHPSKSHSKSHRDFHIAMHIYRYMQAHGPGTWEAAIADAQGKFAKKGVRVSLPTIKRAWSKHRAPAKRLYDKMPAWYQNRDSI
jgi:hypothetical protein